MFLGLKMLQVGVVIRGVVKRPLELEPDFKGILNYTFFRYYRGNLLLSLVRPLHVLCYPLLPLFMVLRTDIQAMVVGSIKHIALHTFKIYTVLVLRLL